jgi:hypothetical protein
MDKGRERFNGRRPDGLFLPAAKTIYVFRCSDSGLYAFTTDPKGQMLPSRIYPQIHWRFQGSVTLRLDENSPKWKILRAMLDAIAKHGFHLIHAAANTELLTFTAQHYDQGIDSPDDAVSRISTRNQPSS